MRSRGSRLPNNSLADTRATRPITVPQTRSPTHGRRQIMARFQQTATANTAPDAVYAYPADSTKHQQPAPPGIAKHTPDQTCDSKRTQVAFTEFGGESRSRERCKRRSRPQALSTAQRQVR